MSRAFALALAALLVAKFVPATAGADDDAPLRIEFDEAVRALAVRDADGDGVADLVTLDAKRMLRVVLGRRGDALATAPTYAHRIADDVSFVTLDPTAKPPGYVTIGRRGAARHGWNDPTPRPIPGSLALAWTGADGPAMSEGAPTGGALVLPAPTGWLVSLPDREPWTVPATPRTDVEAAAPFLESKATVTTTWVTPFVGRAPGTGSGAAEAVWLLESDALVAHARPADGASRSVRWPLAPLPAGAVRILRDLDADGRPEVIERVGTNQESHYALARPTLHQSAPRLVPLGGFRLAGFQLDPEWTDVNGDGRLDVVITSIPIHGANILKTITASRVQAWHNAFLQRPTDAAEPFAAEPDGVVESEIEVAARFTFAGTIEVDRAVTLLVDVDRDGDGRHDLLRRDATGLRWHRGVASGVWEKDGVALSIPPRGESIGVPAYSGDLDGDGCDEVILLYRAPPGGRDAAVVLRGGR